MRFSSLRALPIALLLIAYVATGDAPQDDAGIGGDASDEGGTPSAIDFGSFRGTLASRDEDWFSGPAQAGPACFDARTHGDGVAAASLGLRVGAVTQSVWTLLAPEDEPVNHFALAGSGATPILGLKTIFGSSGEYGFSWSRISPATTGGDAGTSMDAGGLLSGAIPIQRGCTGGTLTPLAGLGDTVDVFAFDGRENQTLIYSLGSASDLVTLTLVGPDGSPLGSALTTNGLASVELPVEGQYTFEAKQTSGTLAAPYLIGIIADPGSGCRPYCAIS